MTKSEWNFKKAISELPVTEIYDRESYDEGFRAGIWAAAEEVHNMMIGLSDELLMHSDSSLGAGLALKRIEGIISEIQDLQPEED